MLTTSLSLSLVFKAVAVVHSSKGSRSEQLFHPPCDVSPFYDVADLEKEPILFTPVKQPAAQSSPPPPKVRLCTLVY